MASAAADKANALSLLKNAAHIGVKKIEHGPLTPTDLPAMRMPCQRQIHLTPECTWQKIGMMRQ